MLVRFDTQSLAAILIIIIIYIIIMFIIIIFNGYFASLRDFHSACP
jgi:hypothetical protein